MVVAPGSKLVLMAILLRLLSEVLAPPPLPPRQLPVLRQTVPDWLGMMMLLLVVGVAKDRLLVYVLIPS